MATFTSHGPCDSATWGAYTGHANDPRAAECFSDECGAEYCPDCTNGSCRACVDKFIRDFVTAPYPAQWLRDQGCDVIRDEDGDESVTEALQSMASLYVQGQSTGNAFFRVMQKLSSQAHEEMMLSKRVLA